MSHDDRANVIFFISDGRVGVAFPDGGEARYPGFEAPNQAVWQLAYLFPHGREAVMWSQEPPRNPDAPFDHPDGRAHARTRLWRCDLETGGMTELDLPTGCAVVGVLAGGQRMLVVENDRQVATFVSVDLTGGQRTVLHASPGYAYGAALSPDASRVAFHITGAPGAGGYQIHVLDVDSGRATVIASDPAWLYFGPSFSPDGQWLLYQGCAHHDDPGHDRSDLRLSRVDGSEHRMLTSGQSHWFAAAYGTPERHSSGSNAAAWAPDGRCVLAALLSPGARTAWPYRRRQVDLDHFNRDYRPEQARGGAALCLIDVDSGKATPITADDPPAWYCRPTWSPDGKRLAVARIDLGQQPELWIMRADGSQPRRLTGGLHDAGADHFKWVELTPRAAERLKG